MKFVFQQGAPKTASSFVAQLARAVATQNGFDQALEGGGYMEVIREIPDCPKYSVIKTHFAPEAAEHELKSGQAVAFISFRDPLDCIQSSLDHAAKSTGPEAEELKNIKGIEDAITLHLKHLAHCFNWMRLPNTYPIYYEDIKADPERVVKFMAERMGLPVNAEQLVSELGQIRRFNKGVSGRGQELLSGPGGSLLKERLAPLYQSPRWLTSTIA